MVPAACRTKPKLAVLALKGVTQPCGQHPPQPQPDLPTDYNLAGNKAVGMFCSSAGKNPSLPLPGNCLLPTP